MIPKFLRPEVVPYASIEIVPATTRIICAWCPSFDRTALSNRGASHTMCPVCAARMNAELDIMEAAAHV